MKLKKIFISVFIILFLILIIVQREYLEDFFLTSKDSSVGSLKSSCRLVPNRPFANSSLNRAEKLNRLMDTAIDWVFTDLKGELIDLYCLRGKKKLVLNFWATWCPPCIKELSSLSQLARDNKDKIFVVAISTEESYNVENFLQRSFSDLDSALKVAVVREGEKLKYFPKDSLPATYIFNTKGFLKIKELGDRDWADKNIVQSILSLD